MKSVHLMATHFSILSWKVPWTEKHGGLSMGSPRVGHDLTTKWDSLTLLKFPEWGESIQ